MKPNKKQKLFIVLLTFVIVVIIVIYFSYYLNKPKNLNVLLITIDCLRPDHLGCYGYKRNASPNLDRLAKEGVLFSQAIAQSSHTPTSMGSILTSTMPSEHLLLGWGYSLNPGLTTIAEVLKAKGYKTIFIGANDNFQTGLHGFARGFDVFYEERGNTIRITNKIFEFIEEYINKPFFVWIHYMDVHSPYVSLSPYDKLYINDELYGKRGRLPIVRNSLDWYGFEGIPETLAKKKGGIDSVDYYIAQYDGAVRTVDEEIGRVIKTLAELQLDKKTIIIVTSDHGEMLGEHNYYFHHGWFLYEPLIRVPLIIKCDKIIPENKVIDIPISAHLDIAVTVLDILNIDKIKTMEGTSLLGLIRGRKKYYPPYVFSDEGYTVKSIRSNEWKLICNLRNTNKEYELYNLKDDPTELKNLVSLEKEKFEFLKQKLDKYRQASLQNGITKSVLDRETKEKLYSLGYLR